MTEEQFLMVLPSNSSMRYFPDNTTTNFVTELSQTVHLHGEWEVALSEIQYPCNFLHVARDENVIKFVDIENDEKKKKSPKIKPIESIRPSLAYKTVTPFEKEEEARVYFASIAEEDDNAFTPKESVIPIGIYRNIEELVSSLNSACKHADSHFYFEYRPEAGGKIGVWLNCTPTCHLTHHMALSDKLQRILGCATETFDKSISLVTLTLRKSTSDRILYTEIFYRAGFISEKTHNVGFFATEPASLLRGIPDKMFVYCDLCESYVTGDVRSPLLRIVPIEAHTDIFAYGANHVKYFSPTHYIPLRKTNFRTIEIDIRDQLGKKIPFEGGTLTVTLHFRRVR